MGKNKTKRTVRLTGAVTTDPTTKEKTPAVRASTKLGNKTVSAMASTEAGALTALQARVEAEETLAAHRQAYPRNTEVDW